MIIAGLAALDACRPEYIPAYRAENLYMGKTAAVDHQIIRTIASLAAISAIVYCHNQQREFTPPDVNCSYIENMLLMMGHVEKKTGRPNPKSVKYVERLWILTADHEVTHSTANFLHTASSLNDPLINLISGFSASWGILHGGAIEVAYRHIQKVGNVNAVHDMIEGVKAGKGRLFGYGHRIYKTIDPRYESILEILNEISSSSDVQHDPILAVALEIDRVASSDEYFTSRHLHANADLLASFVYKSL